MKPPKKRDSVARHVPVVHPDIKEKEYCNGPYSEWQVDHPHEAQRMGTCPVDHPHRDPGEQEPCQGAVQDRGQHMGKTVRYSLLSILYVREHTFKGEKNAQDNDDDNRFDIHDDF